MVSRGGDALTFNQRNRLVAYQAGAGGETRFVYDADGNRLQRRAPDGSVLTSLDGVFERTVAGSTVTDRVWYTFGGQTVGSHTKTNTTGGQRAWIVTDHLNTHGIEVDAATGAVGRAFFDPFGAPRGVAGAGVTTDVGYTGQRHDTTTGLMHYQSRYYDPALKRFISPDTIIPDPANPQDLNRYTYTRNNPTRYNDPTGHWVDQPSDCSFGWSNGACRRGLVPPFSLPYISRTPPPNPVERSDTGSQGGGGWWKTPLAFVVSGGMGFVCTVAVGPFTAGLAAGGCGMISAMTYGYLDRTLHGTQPTTITGALTATAVDGLVGGVTGYGTYKIGAVLWPLLARTTPSAATWLDDAARSRVPSGWGPGSPNRSGVGTRWTDPANPGNGIRIDQGNPLSSQVAQQVDHVIVRHNGVVIGRDGSPLPGAIRDYPKLAHIPLDEWLTWSEWFKP